MRPSTALDLHRQAVRELAARQNLLNPRVFGSVVHGTDTDASDLDILVDAPLGTTYFQLGEFLFAVEDLLGVRVDVKTPDALGESFRAVVLAEAVPV